MRSLCVMCVPRMFRMCYAYRVYCVCTRESFGKFRYNGRFVCYHASYVCVVNRCLREPQNGPIT